MVGYEFARFLLPLSNSMLCLFFNFLWEIPLSVRSRKAVNREDSPKLSVFWETSAQMERTAIL